VNGRRFFLSVLSLALPIFNRPALVSAGIKLDWVTQFGTSLIESSTAVVGDAAGNVFVVGTSSPAIGENHAGSSQVYLWKFNPVGELVHSYQYGTPYSESALSAVIDAQGNIYISGTTTGYFGERFGGGRDAFVSKIDNNGQLLWTQQYGGFHDDYGHGVAVDGAGNVYLSGYTYIFPQGGHDTFLRKYSPDGEFYWGRTLEFTSSVETYDMTVDRNGDVYLAGHYSSNAALTKYSADGDFQWTRTVATPMLDFGLGVESDEQGSLYFMGWSGGTGDPREVFVSRFDEGGKELWTKRLGPQQMYRLANIETLPDGGVLLTGVADPTADRYGVAWDVALRRLDSNGETLAAHEFGSDVYDIGSDIWLGENGRVYVTGTTEGILGESSFGRRDPFLAAYMIAEIEGFPGDYNNNRMVDAADYVVWRHLAGQHLSIGNENPDALTPGLVDLEDFEFWKRQYGKSTTFGSANSAARVPEPTVCGSLLCGCLILLGMRHKITCSRVRRSVRSSLESQAQRST
jgi:hypothetical protein